MNRSPELQEIDDELDEIRKRLRVLEANQAPPESDSTACSPAGCGHLEQVTAGRSPDRETIAKVLAYLDEELVHLASIEEWTMREAVKYDQTKTIFQHISSWNRA